MFRRIRPVTDPVRLRFEGEAIVAQRGDTVAAALLGAGISTFRRSPISGAPRAPLCLIGNCFECLVEIDGEPNRQACWVLAAEGMDVRLQQGLRSVGPRNDY